jgi:hypothetical protein
VAKQGLHAVEADRCDDDQRENPSRTVSRRPSHVINAAKLHLVVSRR